MVVELSYPEAANLLPRGSEVDILVKSEGKDYQLNRR